MCLIIANPGCKPVPEKHITSAHFTNDDGFGIMWAENDQLKIIRGMFNIETIKVLFARAERKGLPYVAHFRMATHGTKDGNNCHPFRVSEDFGGIGMVHNGVLSGSEWRTTGKSDTALLVDRLSKHIADSEISPWDLFEKQTPPVLERYGSSIGSDKLVFMCGSGAINIVNEKYGDWLEEVWYSNTYSIQDWGSSYGWGDDDDEAAARRYMYGV